MLIAGIPSFFWFTHGIWISGDFLIPLNPSISKFIQDFGYAWNYVVNDLGGPYIWLPRFPYRIFFVLLNQLGFDLTTSERLYFYLTYTLPGLSMYYLVKTLFGKYPICKQRITAITSGLVYMYNPFLFVTFAYLPYGLMPLFLALLIKGIKDSSNIRYVIAFAIVATLINITFPTAGILILAIILAIGFTAYLFVLKEVQRFFFSASIFFISSSLFLFLLNAWWILPYLEQYSVFSTQLAITPVLRFVYRNAILIELLRWLGWWPYYTEYYPYTYAYRDNPFLVIVSILPMIFASYTLLLKNQKKEVVFLFLLIVFGLFMAKGPNPPFGELVDYLLANVPLMKFLRETPKFMLIVTLAISILIGVACSDFYFRLKKYSPSLSSLALISFLLLLIINAFPVISGQILFRINDPKNVSVVVPKDYFIVSNLIKDTDGNNYTTLSFPCTPAYIRYEWGHAGSNILPEIFETPLIYGLSITTSNPHLKEVISEPESYTKLLSLINVKYIIVDKTITSVSNSRTLHVINSLVKNPDVSLLFNSSYLMLFKIKSPTPRIYIAKCILFSPNLKSAELTINFLNLSLPVIFDSKEAIRLPENLNIPIYIVVNASSGITELSSQGKFRKYEISSPVSSNFAAYWMKAESMAYIGNFFLSRGNNSIYVTSNSVESGLLIFVLIGQRYLSYDYHSSIKLISPTEYVLNTEISSQTSVFLVFSNVYDQLWELSVNGTATTFRRYHYKTLLETNVWIISPVSEKMSARIYYKPQLRLQFGLYISLFGSLVFLTCYSRLSSFKKK
ncbi:MAG: alpha-(1-_3)-arabinofuranosyltransferase family protein [Nitrososphaeria archaeon]